MKVKKFLVALLTLVMLISCVSITAFAEGETQLTVNNGEDCNTNLPYCTTTVAYSDAITQFIQPSNDITAMTGKSITGMTFYATTLDATGATFEVRLMETNETTFTHDNILDVTDATLVYTGSADPGSGGKVTITFTTPYGYSGGNLLVDFRIKTTGSNRNINFYGVNQSYNSGLTFWRMTSTITDSKCLTFLPKVTFNYATLYALTSAVSGLPSGLYGGVEFTVNSQPVTTAAAGDTVTAAAVLVEGYKATLSAKNADNAEVTINADGTFTMPDKAVTVTAKYTPYTYLDLELDATYLDSKTIDQTYTLTQTGDTTYTDKTKVKVEWTLPEISASFAVAKTWNPDTMSWDENKNIGEIGQKTATFTFTNYSSVKVCAELSFKKAIVAGSASEVIGTPKILDTVVNENHTLKTGEVQTGAQFTHTYTPLASEFNSLNEGAGTYGTYTASIKSVYKVTFNMNGQGDAIDAQYIGKGGKVTAPAAPTASGYTFDGWYKEAECSTQWNFDSDTVTADTTLYAKWTTAN